MRIIASAEKCLRLIKHNPLEESPAIPWLHPGQSAHSDLAGYSPPPGQQASRGRAHTSCWRQTFIQIHKCICITHVYTPTRPPSRADLPGGGGGSLTVAPVVQVVHWLNQVWLHTYAFCQPMVSPRLYCMYNKCGYWMHIASAWVGL